MSRDEATLLDIVNFSRRIVSLTSNWAREDFEGDELKQLSILHLFTLLGEAVRRLSGELRDAHANIAWARIVGMRNHLIHDYDDVDRDLVWTTAVTSFPNSSAELMPWHTNPGKRSTRMTNNVSCASRRSIVSSR